jgi:hypothetical protein
MRKKMQILATSNSQACQESFVLNVLNWKRAGTYVEIGAFHAFEISNTSRLENEFGWVGVAFEIDASRVHAYNKLRDNKCILGDATLFDYQMIFDQLQLPDSIDYLQIDIEPSRNSFKALIKILKSDRKFKVVTFEHDAFVDTVSKFVRMLSRIVFYANGYSLAIGNVSNEGAPDSPFEDWWIHRSILSEIVDLEKFHSWGKVNLAKDFFNN